MGDSALLNFKEKMLRGEVYPRPLQKHKAHDKWPDLDRSHGQVEASPLRLFSECFLISEELRKGGRERKERK